jgi:hypothetical protein
MGRKLAELTSDSIGNNGCWCRLVISAVFVLGTATGCGVDSQGKSTAHLQGTITIDGEPLPNDAEGSITFKPTTPGQAKSTGAQILAGKYNCPEAPVGPVKVYISIQQRTGKMISDGGVRSYPEMKELIAPGSGAGIELEVTGDNLKQDFDMESA